MGWVGTSGKSSKVTFSRRGWSLDFSFFEGKMEINARFVILLNDFDRDFRFSRAWRDVERDLCRPFTSSQSKMTRPKSWTAFCKSSSSDEIFFLLSSSESDEFHPVDPFRILPFIFPIALGRRRMRRRDSYS